MAEGYYNHFTKTNDAKSAGVSDTAYKKYPRPVDEVVQVMKEDGINVSEKKVKKVTQEMIDESDKIFVMCEREMCPTFLLNSDKAVFWEVEDPYEMSIDGFRKIRDIIKSKVGQVII